MTAPHRTAVPTAHRDADRTDTRGFSAATAEAFATAFRHHPAGVSLISATAPAGPVGLTASSVTSVSIDPPTVAFSVMHASRSATAVLDSPTVVVHLLADTHREIADTFARPGTARFSDEQRWAVLDTGEPYLPDARAALRCSIERIVPAGTSSLVLARVLSIAVTDPARPLIYLDRQFHTLDI
ncbi:flavin reductase family protein [Rhodococcus sp. NPDC058532]|uniref:flavin reductase family protein n=1 Tax=Rhodococcus sp. NPDC058532 TaxID=3346540 RepID=UPI0036588340